MANKVMIVGTGNVGMSFAFTLLHQHTSVEELVLVDVNADDAEGEAIDLHDALAVAPNFLKIKSGTYRDAGDCDLVVITAGVPQKPGETRMDLLKANAKVFQDIVRKITLAGFDGIFLVISNPMDIMTYLTWRYSGLPPERVIGSGTVLDTARLRYRLSQRLHVNPKNVHAYQVGEHGDSEFSLWSRANIGGEPIANLIDENAQSEIEDYVRQEAYTIIQKKGATFYGISSVAALIVNCILRDERRILPVSNYDEQSKTYHGWPAIVGQNGIVRRLKLELATKEQTKFDKSMAVLRGAIEAVEPQAQERDTEKA